MPAVDHAVPFVDVTTRLFMTAAKKRVTPAARATTTEQWAPVRRRTHLNPPPPNRVVERVFVRGVADVRPTGWVVGDDGLLVELPADSDFITIRTVD